MAPFGFNPCREREWHREWLVITLRLRACMCAYLCMCVVECLYVFKCIFILYIYYMMCKILSANIAFESANIQRYYTVQQLIAQLVSTQ